MPLMPALGTLLAPVPLMSLHAVPPLIVCQTCPTLTPPMTTQASLVLAGLKVMPPIQPFGLTTSARVVNAGRLPVMSVQVGEAAVALVLMKTLPTKLAVITTFAFDGPVVISCSLSVGPLLVPKVRSLLTAFQLPGPGAEGGPGGTPPLVEVQTRLVPAKRRWALEGSMTKGAVKAVGSVQAGSVELKRQGPASTNESSGEAASPPTIVELPRNRPPPGFVT